MITDSENLLQNTLDGREDKVVTALDRAQTAILQIKDKKYIDALKDYQGDVVLVGINYQKIDTKSN